MLERWKTVIEVNRPASAEKLDTDKLAANQQKNLELDMQRVITIDGPAASGKTSVSRDLARRLGWCWVSTGAFYRGLAYVAKVTNFDLTDEEGLSRLALSNKWRVEMDEQSTKVFFEGKDVTDQIMHEDVGNVASKISHFPKVRASLLTPQRDCQKNAENKNCQGLIAEGRDCGTVVFPNASLKIYLTADQDNRAERRAKELGLSKDDTVQAQIQRDKQDSTRKAAPLQVPANAVVVDTTELTLTEVVDVIEARFKQSAVLS